MTTAQHGRLKNEQEWILSAGTAAHPENGWSESTAQRIAHKVKKRISLARLSEVLRY